MARTSNGVEKWRFYRSNLSTIVWDPAGDCALADFTEGHFTTDNPKVAKTLAALGYVQIPLDAVKPPEHIIVRQPTVELLGDVPVMSPALGEALVEQRMSKKMKEVGKPEPQPEPQQEQKPKKKVVAKAPARKTVALTRRRKKAD